MPEHPKTRILQLIPVCGDSVAYVAKEFMRSLPPDRTEVVTAHLFCGEKQAATWAPDTDAVLYLDLPARERWGIRIQAIRRLKQLVETGDFDIVVCHRNKAAELMSLVRLLVRPVRLVYVVHGMRRLSGFVAWKRRLRARLLFRKRFLYITVSEFIRQEFLASGIPGADETLYCVHNSLDVAAFDAQLLPREQAREQLGLPPSAYLFGSIGRLVGFKNQQLLIHAFARLADTLPDSRLVIIGGGKLAGRLQALARELGVAERVDFCGQVRGAARYLRAFDGFVFSSLREPFGIALLEAMAAGLPVLAVASGGIPEIIGDCGILADRPDPEVFASNMHRLYRLGEAERQELVAAAREKLRRQFSRSDFPEMLGKACLLQASMRDTGTYMTR
jgi:glycosyltransferase involved in cell wall biosynthesis